MKAVPASPLYPPALGLALVGCYALLLGGGGTLAEPAMLVFADTVDGPAAVGRSPLRRNVLIATTAAGVAVRPSPCSPRPAALAPREGYSFEHLPPTVAASRYLRLQPRDTYGCSLERLLLQVGLLLSLLKLLLHLPFLALLLPLAAVAGALSTQARPRNLVMAVLGQGVSMLHPLAMAASG